MQLLATNGVEENFLQASAADEVACPNCPKMNHLEPRDLPANLTNSILQTLLQNKSGLGV